MRTYIKLSKAKILEIIQSCRSLGSWLVDSDKKIAICFDRNNLPGLVSKITSNAASKFRKKIRGKDLGVLIDGFTQTI